jgi:hypothetical protein
VHYHDAGWCPGKINMDSSRNAAGEWTIWVNAKDGIPGEIVR